MSKLTPSGSRTTRSAGRLVYSCAVPVGPFVAGQIDPDPVADSQVADPVADGVDHAGAVLVGCHLGEGR